MGARLENDLAREHGVGVGASARHLSTIMVCIQSKWLLPLPNF